MKKRFYMKIAKKVQPRFDSAYIFCCVSAVFEIVSSGQAIFSFRLLNTICPEPLLLWPPVVFVEGNLFI